jgi:acyl carrier protein
MARSQVLLGIENVVSTHLGHKGPVRVEMPLVETFALDSVRMLTLVVELENHFRVNLEPGDETDLVSVGDLVSLLERRVGSG